MKFDDQVKKAKEEKLKYRITRDLLFIALGIIFLIVSIILAYKDNNNNNNTEIKNNNSIKNSNDIKKTK